MIPAFYVDDIAGGSGFDGTGDLAVFFRRHSAGKAADEVQRVPELLLAIKESADKDKTPGRFLLTKSSNLVDRLFDGTGLPGVVNPLVGDDLIDCAHGLLLSRASKVKTNYIGRR